MMHLQDANKKSAGVTSSVGSHVGSLVFQRVVGSMGGSLDFGPSPSLSDARVDECEFGAGVAEHQVGRADEEWMRTDERPGGAAADAGASVLDAVDGMAAPVHALHQDVV